MNPRQAPQAQDFMIRSVLTVPPDMTLTAIIDFLAQHHISSAPVVESGPDGQLRLAGFISEADCLAFLSNEVFFGDPSPHQTARTMMRRHPMCVEPTTDIFTLASIFVHHRHRHLPVVDGGQLLGLVSRRDILRALNVYYSETARANDLEKHPPDLHELMNMRFVPRAFE
jgi:CBS domain-containing protein